MAIWRAAIWGIIALWAGLAQAQGLETSARAVYIYDQTTGTVLLNKNADVPLPPASMSKLMTIYMAFEAIADGRLRVDDLLPVSDHAVSFRGSSMFLNTTDRVRVDDLLRGVIVLSGNDASVVLAEALSPDGTEAGFARLMTQKAQELGMTQSHFVNASGWPAAGHVMSTRDLGILSSRLITDFPTFYSLFGETEFPFDLRVPSNTINRNPILGMGIGADGLKTGHTAEAGYGLAGSAVQGDRRVVFVVTGLNSARERAEESEKIVNWAFRQFALRQVATAGNLIASADVWMGDAPSVGLTVAQDVRLLVPSGAGDTLDAQVIFDGPVQAPVQQGQVLGELVITLDGLPQQRVPLVADADVGLGGFGVRLRSAAQVLWRKYGPAAQPDATGT